MSVRIHIVANTKPTEDALKRMEAAFSPAALDKVVDHVAFKTLLDMVKATPKKWTGQLRREWRVVKPMEAVRLVANNSKVLGFLEYGTKNGGTGYIYPVRKKALFIPLTRKAAMQGWSKGLVKQGIFRVRGGGWMWRSGDYLLAKRVRGIKPRGIVYEGQKRADVLLANETRKYVRQVVEATWGR